MCALVTGVQTCALPISDLQRALQRAAGARTVMGGDSTEGPARAAGAGYARRHPRLIRVAGAPAYRASRNREGCGMGQRPKILIVDDHPLPQSDLRLLLAGQDRSAVIGALDRGSTVSDFVPPPPVA